MVEEAEVREIIPTRGFNGCHLNEAFPVDPKSSRQ